MDYKTATLGDGDRIRLGDRVVTRQPAEVVGHPAQHVPAESSGVVRRIQRGGSVFIVADMDDGRAFFARADACARE